MAFDTRRLGAITTLADLPSLVAALGHEPLWQELEPETWAPGDLSASVARAAVVGRAGGFGWFGIEVQPGAAAGELAGRAGAAFLRRNTPAGFMVLDPLSRTLALSVSWEGAPLLTLSLDAPGRAALATLARMGAVTPAGSLALAMALADALGTEGLGRRFFQRFSTVAGRFAAEAPGPPDPESRQGWALLQLTRVLFLYFVQAKGWLNGDEHFLASRVDDQLRRGRSLQRSLFTPLFFGTLNRRISRRAVGARALGHIPFLNGGLFDRHPLDRRFPEGASNQLWRAAFDDLFERFHFTVSEGERDGIAPDMLGRVFEGLMAPEHRRASGTFYTPAPLVRALVNEALAVAVAGRLGIVPGEAAEQLGNRTPAALTALESVTILDPAAGSGAFLLGALERVAELLTPPGQPAALTRERRRVLRQSLFGVDLSATAVRLAELRLWLAVIADDPADDPSRIEPLPNLDCVVRQGDALADPLGIRPAGSSHTRLGRLRARAVTASGRAKQRLITALRQAELEAMQRQLGAVREDFEREIRACLADARSPTLFGDRRGLDRELRRRLAQARARHREAGRAARRLMRDGELPWFHFEGQFADVFARGGFDLVVGNPPWVRAESLDPALRERLAQRYRWWRTGRSGAGWGHRPDLAVAFLERAWELVRPGGVVALLVPAKLATAGYGAAARHALATTGTIHLAAPLGAEAARAFDATVYPLALLVQRSAAEAEHRVRTALISDRDDPGGPLQRTLTGGDPWLLRGDAVHAALRELRGSHPTVAHHVTARLGVKTGANAVFLDPEDVEPELLRWAIRGRDLGAFRWRRRRRILWTHDETGRPLAALPRRAARYLDRHGAALLARRDYPGGPPWLLFRTAGAVGRARVVWADLARRLTAAALTRPADRAAIPLNTCYVVSLSSCPAADAFAGWLNSSWIRTAAMLTAVPAAGGFHRFTATTVGGLPLPPAALEDAALAALARRGADGEEIQEELDDRVAYHLALGQSARAALRAVAGRDTADRR